MICQKSLSIELTRQRSFVIGLGRNEEVLPIPLSTSPLKGEEVKKVAPKIPPLQGEGKGGDGTNKLIFLLREEI
ncbi:MAG: hypothetical protein A2V86_16975 [Deltaproteobacteria bacterium RBG_16_49_23]|nr:MAG: hypothetical protein A2V86_16975 [Deltaproteobacteria bacterium RBG_16_49_23]